MSTVSSPLPPFNLARFANKLLAGPQAGTSRDSDLAVFHSTDSERTWHDGPLPVGAGGHPDEGLSQLADPEPTQAELLDGLVEWEAEQAVQRADDHHAAEMRDAIRQAKEKLGTSVAIQFSRDLTIDSETGASIGYSCFVLIPGHPVIAVGSSPAIALQNALADVAKRDNPAAA